MSAFLKLLAIGVTVQQAREFIIERLDAPAAIFNAAKAVGLTTSDLGEIVGVSSSIVQSFFTSRGINWYSLEFARTQSLEVQSAALDSPVASDTGAVDQLPEVTVVGITNISGTAEGSTFF